MNTRHYEMLYIIPIKFLGEEASVIEKINSLLKKFGAQITAEDILGKKRLYYPIKATHQGIYVATEFDINAENLKKLEGNLKLTFEILRHLIVEKKKKTAEEIKKEQELQEKMLKKTEDKLDQQEEISAAQKEAVPASRQEKKDKKISLDDLDVKLDEILKNDVL
ncbi:MAG: 30S ribosomal protein S6 [Candidatus Falkowbacteria bacterium]